MWRARSIPLVVLGFSLSTFAIAQEAPQRREEIVSIEILIVEIASDVQKQAGIASSDSADATLEKIRSLEKQGKIKFLSRAVLSTIEHQPAMVQLGETVSVVTGRASSAARGGRAPTTYSRQQTGTIFRVTPRVEDDRSIVMEVEVEQSRLVPPPVQTTGNGEEPPAVSVPRTTTLVARTTLRIADGKAAIVGGVQVASADQASQTMILATARVLDSKRAKPAKENKGNEAGAHIFYLKRIVAKNAAGVLREVLADQKLTVAADERLNAIIITGKRETVKNAETVLEQLDRQAKE